jgi:hypothetical protein
VTGSLTPQAPPVNPAPQAAATTDEVAAPALASPAAGSATAVLTPPPPAEEPARRKPVRPIRAKKARTDDLFDFFAAPAVDEGVNGAKSAISFGPAFEEPAVAGVTDGAAPDEAPSDEVAGKLSRVPRGAPPLNPALLRKAINQIMPLFAGEDPGAKDCLKDNRATFRAAFTPEAYAEFEQAVKAGDFPAAIEHLKKAGRRHGVAV